MTRLGPVYTLAAGAAIVVALGTLSATTSPTTQNVNAQDEVAAPAAPEVIVTTAEATPTPEVTKTVKPTPVKADYAGRVQGNGGLIAISIRNGKAVGYFCDGKIEAWMKGRPPTARSPCPGRTTPRSSPRSAAAGPEGISSSAARSGTSRLPP